MTRTRLKMLLFPSLLLSLAFLLKLHAEEILIITKNPNQTPSTKPTSVRLPTATSHDTVQGILHSLQSDVRMPRKTPTLLVTREREIQSRLAERQKRIKNYKAATRSNTDQGVGVTESLIGRQPSTKTSSCQIQSKRSKGQATITTYALLGPHSKIGSFGRIRTA